MRVARSVSTPDATARKVYSPLSVVSAPRVVPTMDTCALGTGLPVALSVTFPEIVPCANAVAGTSQTPTANAYRQNRVRMCGLFVTALNALRRMQLPGGSRIAQDPARKKEPVQPRAGASPPRDRQVPGTTATSASVDV